MTDYGVPTKEWFPESVELFNKLNKLTTEETGWIKLKSNPHLPDGSVDFSRAVPAHQGKFMEYAFFYNSKLNVLKGVAQFGLNTRGPPGVVHGGALISVLDASIGNCAYKGQYGGVTANLNVNFRRPVLLNSTVLIETKVDKVEGKKVFLSGFLKSVCEEVTYADATALFITNTSNI